MIHPSFQSYLILNVKSLKMTQIIPYMGMCVYRDPDVIESKMRILSQNID